MAHSTFTFQVDHALKTAFAKAAKSEDRTAAQLLRVLMRETVRRREEAGEHDAWFRGEVGQAMREADDPDMRRIPHNEVRTSWRRQRAELARRANKKIA